MRNTEHDDTNRKKIRSGSLAGAIICWLIVFGLMACYFIITVYEYSRTEELISGVLNNYRILVDYETFLYVARVIAYAFLATFSYAALELSSKIRINAKPERQMKLAFFQTSVPEMLAIWLVFLYSSCIEYYLLFQPGQTAGVIHFVQNMFGALSALLIIRLLRGLRHVIVFSRSRRIATAK